MIIEDAPFLRPQEKAVPKNWDRETDVVVIGTGFAGFAAAIEAHDAGSNVIILEKNSFIGGNSIIATGAYNAVDPERQENQGIEDSIDLHYRQTIEAGDFKGEPDKVRFLSEHALNGLKWLEDMGVQFESTVYTGIGALWPRTHDPVNKGRGAAIVRALKRQVTHRGIPILMKSGLSAILRERSLEGDVLGVRYVNNEKAMYIRARQAVVICTGGFGADMEMRSQYDPRLTVDIPTTNVRTATGEVIRYAMDIGADIVGMDQIQLLVACNYYTKKYGSLVNLGIDSAIFINKNGVRFVAEDRRRDVLANAILKQPDKMLLWIADEACNKRYKPHLIRKIIKNGYAFTASGPEALGKTLRDKFNIPPETFLRTIRRYNESAKAGIDEDFGKARQNLKPIGEPPLYASPVMAGVHYTMGGLKTGDITCRVLDRHGNTIPHLYAAGEVTGGMHGANRVGGNATAECIVFGREAGMRAAREYPR
jgi:urocanate reductase